MGLQITFESCGDWMKNLPSDSILLHFSRQPTYVNVTATIVKQHILTIDIISAHLSCTEKERKETNYWHTKLTEKINNEKLHIFV